MLYAAPFLILYSVLEIKTIVFCWGYIIPDCRGVLMRFTQYYSDAHRSTIVRPLAVL